MITPPPSLNIGIVGAGGFAKFFADSVAVVEGINIAAITDINLSASSSIAHQFGAKVHNDYDDLLRDDAVDLVYIATPPHLHHEQSRSALLAGKHVICEKPAALSTAEAEELVCLEKAVDRLYCVNLMQRYNPLFDLVKSIFDQDILGSFLHGYFENYASDEFLGQKHWFWDETRSGGIFIEHGVHFFDLFAGWLGKGELAYSAKWSRPDAAEIYDRVIAIVNYRTGPVTFYHGFDQPKLLDRQELRLQFERGDVTLYGWIPVRAKITGLLDHGDIDRLQAMIQDAVADDPGTGQIEVCGHSGASGEDPPRNGPRAAAGRSKQINFDEHVSITVGDDAQKTRVYAELLRKMMIDQRAWISDNSATRVTTGENAIESLRIAEAATLNAVKF